MNIATNTLKKLVAQWVRGWLPFTVVTKGGWLGFSVIQDAVDYCGTRDGGLVFIGPGTFREAVLIADDYVNIIGCGMGVTKIYAPSGAGYGVKFTGDYDSCSNMTVDTVEGGGHADGHACYPDGDYGMFFRVLNTESDGTGIRTGSNGSSQAISHCVIPADAHDGYGMMFSSPSSVIASNFIHSGGGYNTSIEGTGDETTMVGNICDGDGGTIYGIVIGPAAENCIVSGNWVGNFLSTDIWDLSGTSLTSVPDGGGPLNETV